MRRITKKNIIAFINNRLVHVAQLKEDEYEFEVLVDDGHSETEIFIAKDIEDLILKHKLSIDLKEK